MADLQFYQFLIHLEQESISRQDSQKIMQRVALRKQRFKSERRKYISYKVEIKILNGRSIGERWENTTPPWSPSMRGKVSQSSESHRRDELEKRVYDSYSSPLEGCWKRGGFVFIWKNGRSPPPRGWQNSMPVISTIGRNLLYHRFNGIPFYKYIFKMTKKCNNL